MAQPARAVHSFRTARMNSVKVQTGPWRNPSEYPDTVARACGILNPPTGDAAPQTRGQGR